MPDNHVKGVWFVDLAKMVRKLNDLPWERYLTPADLQVIQGTILPAQWYPLDIYQRLGVAAFELVGRKKPENAQLLGRAFVERMLEDEGLSQFLKTGDPERAIQHFATIRKRVLSFGEARIDRIGDRHLRYHIQWPQGQIGIFPFVHNLAGCFFRILEINGGKNIRITFDDQDLDQKDSTAYDLVWE